MLIFNDGPPRAGKSYDTVKNHILPAIKAGRQVFARLDGLDHAAIAKYLNMPEQRVRELLHHVSPSNVLGRFKCHWEPTPDFVPTPEQPEDGGRYVIPDKLRDALVVIDEVHEFYPASMKPLDRAQEQFFARHGQFGMDMVLASQTFDRMHGEIRARVERRVLFRKLSHFAGLAWLGLGGKSRYSMRFSVNDGGGKFKVVGSEMRRYDPAIFPLYQGYQPGTTNTEVYNAGAKEAAGVGLKFGLPFAVLAAVVGLWYAIRFFTGGVEIVPDQAAQPEVFEVYDQPTTVPPGQAGATVVDAGLPSVIPAKARTWSSAGVAYVMTLIESHRPRMLGSYRERTGELGGWVEFVSSQGHAADRLSVRSLRELGFQVVERSYGFDLVADGETVIATQWPIDRWGEQSQGSRQSMRDSAGTHASAATTGPHGSHEATIVAPVIVGSPPSHVVGYGDMGHGPGL